MRVTLNANYSHIINSGFGKESNEKVDNQKLKEVYIHSLKQKSEYKDGLVVWKDNDNVEVSGVGALALYRFVLEAEKLGKNVRFEKKTIIQIIH